MGFKVLSTASVVTLMDLDRACSAPLVLTSRVSARLIAVVSCGFTPVVRTARPDPTCPAVPIADARCAELGLRFGPTLEIRDPEISRASLHRLTSAFDPESQCICCDDYLC